ncbi:hypothetical protein DFP72DRAFT_857335 [Ephemerocybe angulata]|uniref:Uncharacterized protein n=1 Tax=Ephemerocybe angulata TaxID=980116 RepID=A0A8H6HDR7_9AGAR|nr:hypothetical protein DFP72DRAFT_857335 [Tulosesus angulatus]
MEFRTVWDTIISPALMHAVSPRNSSQEPAYPHDSTIHSIPEHCISAFVEKMSERALHSGIRWLTDIYFVHVIRSKSNLHPLNERIKASVTLENYLSENGIPYCDIAQEEILNGNWYIDVGIDVSVPGRCAVWRTECHSDIHKEITDEDHDPADPGYNCHPFSHIVGASGCRMVPRFSPQDTCAPNYAYIDLRMAEDTLRAVDEDGLLLDDITPAHLANRPQNHVPFLHKVAKLYGGRQTHTSAQIVIRASLADADSAFLGFDCRVLDKACLSFDYDDFWYWRALRAFGMSRIMERLRISASLLHRHPGSLALADAIAYIVNSFHTTYHEVTPQNVPYPISTDRGIVFLENISLGGRGEAPHFTEGFSKAHYPPDSNRLPQEYLQLSIALTSHIGPVPSPPPSRPAPCASLPFRSATPFLGSQVPGALYDGNTTSVRKLEFATERDILVDRTMHGFVRQLQNDFFTDILSKAPRTPSRVSCLRSTPQNQQFSDRALFYQANLATAFTAVRWKHATRDEWIRVFYLYFPAHTHSSSSSVVADQYHSLPYFKNWQRLKKTLSGISFEILRSAVWTVFFKSLYWIPFASPHRVWGTGPVGPFTPLAGASPGAPYASVLINGESDPCFDSNLTRASHGRMISDSWYPSLGQQWSSTACTRVSGSMAHGSLVVADLRSAPPSSSEVTQVSSVRFLSVLQTCISTWSVKAAGPGQIATLEPGSWKDEVAWDVRSDSSNTFYTLLAWVSIRGKCWPRSVLERVGVAHEYRIVPRNVVREVVNGNSVNRK